MPKPKTPSVKQVEARDSMIVQVRTLAAKDREKRPASQIVAMDESDWYSVITACRMQVATLVMCELSRLKNNKRGKDTRINESDTPYWKAVRLQRALDQLTVQTMRRRP